MTKTPEPAFHDYISEVSERADIRVGSPLPLGIFGSAVGVNFAVFSRHASRVRLEFFNHPDDAPRNRTGDVWHVGVAGIGPGQLYAYRVEHQEIYQFAREMIAIHRAHPVLSKEQFYSDAEIQWFGPQGELPNWADQKAKQLMPASSVNINSVYFV